jgi:uncharacterized protein YdiU (UPF0061 family)
MLRRLCLSPRDEDSNNAFVTALFGFLSASKAPYEQFFFDWRGGAASAERAARSPSAEFYASDAFRPIANALERYSPADDLNLDHPYFARQQPRTMLIDEMEAIWAPIAERDDWTLFQNTLADIAEMRQAYGIIP